MIRSDPQIAQVIAAAYSAEEAAIVGGELRSALGDQAEVIEHTATTLDQSRPDVGRTFCAAVITLQNAALRRSGYVEFLQICIEQVVRRDDFRLYLLLEDVSVEQIRNSRPQGEELAERVLAQLMDTVQFSATSTAASVARQVREHVETLEDLRRQSLWRRVRLSTATIAAMCATIIQLLCLPPALFLVFWLPVWDTNATLREYGGHEAEVAVICGIAAVPLLVLLLYSYTRYGPFLTQMQKQRLGILYAALGSSIGAPVMGVPIRIHAPLTWIAVGVVSGFLLDAARRRGYAIRRQRHEISIETIARRHGRLLPRLRRQAMPTWIDPLRAPLLPLAFPRVFISYTRGSLWSQSLAGTISERLGSGGAAVFSDHVVPDGTSWRRALNQNLGHASVLIALVDANTVLREWPAAEVEAGLLGQTIASSPRLIVIRAPDLPPPDDESWRWLPVFRTILSQHGDRRESGPIVLVDDEETLENIAAALHPQSYRAPSVFPSALAELLLGLWAIPLMVITLLGSLGPFAGHLAFLVVLTHLVRVDVVGWISKWSMLGTLFVCCCLWLGYTFRLTMASKFQVRLPRWRQITRAHRDASIGLAALIAILSMRVSALAIACGSLIGVIAFYAADRFCESRARSEPTFLRASD